MIFSYITFCYTCCSLLSSIYRIFSFSSRTLVLISLFSAVSAIDTSGVSFFKDLRRVLDKKGLEASHQVFSLHCYSFFFSSEKFLLKVFTNTIYLLINFCVLQLVLVNPIGEVMEKLQRSDDTNDLMRPDTLFLTVGEAVTMLMSTMKHHV